MRAYLPFILVLLAIFTAGCIAYVAWELSSGKAEPSENSDESSDADSDTS